MYPIVKIFAPITMIVLVFKKASLMFIHNVVNGTHSKTMQCLFMASNGSD